MIRLLIIYLFLIIFLIQFKPKIAVNILIIAPNKYTSHFNFHKSIAFSLINQQWVTNVTMLVVEDNPNNREHTFLNNINKLSILYYPTYNREEQILNINTFLQTNQLRQSSSSYTGMNIQGQSNHNCFNLANYFYNFATNHRNKFPEEIKIFFDMAENIELINALCQQNYFIGMAELYDYPIIPFLQFIGCQHIIATSAIPLESIYYKYLGILPQIIENRNIPAVIDTSIDEQCGNGYEYYHNLNVNERKNTFNKIDKIYNYISKKIGFNKPIKFEYLIKNVIKYIFVNNQSFIDFEINKPEKVINIGGITFPFINDEQLLNEQEINIFNEVILNNKRIILVSFGTIVRGKHLTEEQIENICATLNLFPNYLFIWKIEQEYHQIILNNNYNNNNIRLINWINQNSILANQNTILFISHCGMNSTLEAIKYGKSLICIPFMFDQFYISKALERRRVAIVVNKENNFEDLYDKIVGGINYGIRGNRHMNELTNQINSINSVQIFLNKIYELI